MIIENMTKESLAQKAKELGFLLDGDSWNQQKANLYVKEITIKICKENNWDVSLIANKNLLYKAMEMAEEMVANA